MMVHINSNYIHLTKNKPIDWRFKPPLFCMLWPGSKSDYCIVNAILKRQKIITHLFECAVARRFQQAFLGLPELFRKLRNLSQLLSPNLSITTTRSLSLAKNHSKPANAIDESFKRISFFFFYVPLEQTATSIVDGLVKVNVIGLHNNI